jgi:hypothetical protein
MKLLNKVISYIKNITLIDKPKAEFFVKWAIPVHACL